MSDNPKTAEKFNPIRQELKNAAKTSESLQNIFRSSPSPSNNETESEMIPEEPGESESQGQGSSSWHTWGREEDEAIRECFKTNIARRHITTEEIKRPKTREMDAEKTISLFTARPRRGGAFSEEQTNALITLFEDLVRTTAVT